MGNLLSGILGGKAASSSLTVWGLLILAITEAYCQVGVGVVDGVSTNILPFAITVCAVGEKAGIIVTALGLRKAATAANVA